MKRPYDDDEAADWRWRRNERHAAFHRKRKSAHRAARQRRQVQSDVENGARFRETRSLLQRLGGV